MPIPPLTLPPQPKPADYVVDGQFLERAHAKALATWRDVCERMTREHADLARHSQFWNGA